MRLIPPRGAGDGPIYSREPEDKREFTESFDRLYSRFAGAYDVAVKHLPFWRAWLRRALPYIDGPRVLEVSVGTGWLLTQYAGDVEAHAIDLNERMLAVTRRNLRRAGLGASLRRATVEALPFSADYFDTVVNTMSFSGYPDATRALSELQRVMRPGGRLVMIDVGYPRNGNRLGTALTNLWRHSGDLIRDMPALFTESGLDARVYEIGGSGSIHLYVATAREGVQRPASSSVS
jgi:ubiquinone/menaquinone biosynthesis C-methylase UbiE